jgi:hypothetical protein
MNLPPSAQQVTVPKHLAEHLDSTLQKPRSHVQYIGLVKYAKGKETWYQLQEINLA